MVGVASGRVGSELATARSYLKESMARDEGRNGLRSDRMAISGPLRDQVGTWAFHDSLIIITISV